MQIGHAAPVETVSHALYPVAPHLKTALLTELLRGTGPGSVLIFTRTKHRAKRVAEQLERAGFEATSLQGNLSQNKRQAALDGFRAGDFRIMVATDIAARGIDVLSISHVINYDMPDTTDAYTHRIGRTGRAEQTGEAYTLVTADDVNEVRGRRAGARLPAGAPNRARLRLSARPRRPGTTSLRVTRGPNRSPADHKTRFRRIRQPRASRATGRVLSRPARRTLLSGPAPARNPCHRAPSDLKAHPARRPAERPHALPHPCGTAATRLPSRGGGEVRPSGGNPRP